MSIRNRLALIGAGIALGLAAKESIKRRHALDLRGRVVLITGGSRGLGYAMAQEFAQRGSRIVICARNPTPLEQARKELEQMGAEVLAIQCDVSDRAQVQSMIEQATTHFGQIDILVNNAGIITVGPVETMTLNDFEESMNIIFWGTVYPTLAVLPQMQVRKSGRIVNITSIGAKVSVPHLVPYSCAKFAALGFSEGLHAELAKDGITVITVVPGLMRTGSHLNAYFKGKHQEEYSWFGMAATLPGVAMNARRAARQVVHATQRGDTEVLINYEAQLAGRFHGAFPGLTTELLGIVNRFLPGTNGADSERSTGKQSRGTISGLLTAAGESAAHEYNQYTTGS
jgi:NAD(P)-dependent dehydrogenase (short-subunit alcohol dehydrogenase family)